MANFDNYKNRSGGNSYQRQPGADAKVERTSPLTEKQPPATPSPKQGNGIWDSVSPKQNTYSQFNAAKPNNNGFRFGQPRKDSSESSLGNNASIPFGGGSLGSELTSPFSGGSIGGGASSPFGSAPSGAGENPYGYSGGVPVEDEFDATILQNMQSGVAGNPFGGSNGALGQEASPFRTDSLNGVPGLMGDGSIGQFSGLPFGANDAASGLQAPSAAGENPFGYEAGNLPFAPLGGVGAGSMNMPQEAAYESFAPNTGSLTEDFSTTPLTVKDTRSWWKRLLSGDLPSYTLGEDGKWKMDVNFLGRGGLLPGLGLLDPERRKLDKLAWDRMFNDLPDDVLQASFDVSAMGRAKDEATRDAEFLADYYKSLAGQYISAGVSEDDPRVTKLLEKAADEQKKIDDFQLQWLDQQTAATVGTANNKNFRGEQASVPGGDLALPSAADLQQIAGTDVYRGADGTGYYMDENGNLMPFTQSYYNKAIQDRYDELFGDSGSYKGKFGTLTQMLGYATPEELYEFANDPKIAALFATGMLGGWGAGTNGGYDWLTWDSLMNEDGTINQDTFNRWVNERRAANILPNVMEAASRGEQWAWDVLTGPNSFMMDDYATFLADYGKGYGAMYDNDYGALTSYLGGLDQDAMSKARADAIARNFLMLANSGGAGTDLDMQFIPGWYSDILGLDLEHPDATGKLSSEGFPYLDTSTSDYRVTNLPEFNGYKFDQYGIDLDNLASEDFYNSLGYAYLLDNLDSIAAYGRAGA